MNAKDLEYLKSKLLERREDLVVYREKLNASWASLHEPEVEFEEMAQKEVISQGMEQLDDQERKEFEAIGRALRKIENGLYGPCESCGRNISVKRLEAIPWTEYCNQCAGGAESRRVVIETMEEEEEAAAVLPPEYQGLSDEQIELAILDELREDGRVDLQELSVSSEEGVIHLEGALPSSEEHEILIEILEDAMGFHEVVDHLNIDHTLWEREDRVVDREKEGKSDKEVAMQGEDFEEEDMGDSRRSGLTVEAPDHLIPEKERS